MTMTNGWEVAAPGTPVDGEGWHMPPAGLEIRFKVGAPPQTGGFAVRHRGVLLATGEPEAMLPGAAHAPGVVVLAARHLDPAEGRIRLGHRLDTDDLFAIRTVLWFAAGIGEDGGSRMGAVRDGVTVANALAGPPVTAGPDLCGRPLYTVATLSLVHLDGTPPCSAPLPPLVAAEDLAELDDPEAAAALAYRAHGVRPRTAEILARGGPFAEGGPAGPAGGEPLPDWERDLIARQSAGAAGAAGAASQGGAAGASSAGGNGGGGPWAAGGTAPGSGGGAAGGGGGGP
jgi:hypothetical protein